MGTEGADRQEAGRHPPPPSHLCSRCVQDAGIDEPSHLWRAFGDILACESCLVHGCRLPHGAKNKEEAPADPLYSPLQATSEHQRAGRFGPRIGRRPSIGTERFSRASVARPRVSM